MTPGVTPGPTGGPTGKAEVIDESDDVIDARELAKKRSHDLQYGAALIDTETGNVDFGPGWTRTRICPENPPIY